MEVCGHQHIFSLLFTLRSRNGWMLSALNAGTSELLLLLLDCFCFSCCGSQQEESRMWCSTHAISEHLSACLTEALR